MESANVDYLHRYSSFYEHLIHVFSLQESYVPILYLLFIYVSSFSVALVIYFIKFGEFYVSIIWTFDFLTEASGFVSKDFWTELIRNRLHTRD